jgi:hypothetical protein
MRLPKLPCRQINFQHTRCPFRGNLCLNAFAANPDECRNAPGRVPRFAVDALGAPVRLEIGPYQLSPYQIEPYQALAVRTAVFSPMARNWSEGTWVASPRRPRFAGGRSWDSCPEASEPAAVHKGLGNSGNALLESRQFVKMKTGSELPSTSDLENVDDLSKIVGDE